MIPEQAKSCGCREESHGFFRRPVLCETHKRVARVAAVILMEKLGLRAGPMSES